MASKDEAISFGDTVELIERAFKANSNPTALAPHYDSATGRYDNIGSWLDLRKDALVYGVRIPMYAYSPITTAVKTGANAGLVLEASTNTTAGRNDYNDKALFRCLRCNGGVDKDGMPYVTAIEGYDDRFNPVLNTYAITPVYYRRVVNDGNYRTMEYTDTPKEGFSPCRGAYTAGGELRPFILRACYMDSDGQFSSKSGTHPAAYRGSPVQVAHSASNDFSLSKNRASVDGLTYLDYGDVAYQMEFMELMLGVKAPREKAVGCVSYNYQYAIDVAEEGVKRVILTDAQAAAIEVGSSVSVGTYKDASTDRNYSSLHDVVSSATVLSKTPLGSGTTALNLDLAEPVNIQASCRLSTMPWPNGSCDGVLGTFGAPTAAGLINGKMPYKFQNVEWNLGLYEVVHNMHSVGALVDGKVEHSWYVAPDVSACSALNEEAGWTKLGHVTVPTAHNTWNYIKDYAMEKGARVPENVGGTSSTGYRTAWHPGASAGQRELLVGGGLGGGSAAGVGCAYSNLALSYASWYLGGRSSAIGHSAQAE